MTDARRLDSGNRRQSMVTTSGRPASTNGANGTGGTNGVNRHRTSTSVQAPKQERLFDEAASQARVYALVNAYRVRGHLFAKVDPLGGEIDKGPWRGEIDLVDLQASPTSRSRHHLPHCRRQSGSPIAHSLRAIVAHLQATYCSAIGVEYTYVENFGRAQAGCKKRWSRRRTAPALSREESLRVLAKLTDAEIFEQFIHKNYIGAKRFSLEGGESMIAMLDLCIEYAGAQGVEEMVIGMAHRGRLNVMINILGKDVRETFAAFDDKHPDRFIGGGDVKYHHGYSTDVVHLQWAKSSFVPRLQPQPPRVGEPGGRGARSRQARPR